MKREQPLKEEAYPAGVAKIECVAIQGILAAPIGLF